MIYDLKQGNCFDLMQDIDSNYVDMVLVDPPYGTTVAKWDTELDLDVMWQSIDRVAKDDAAIVIHAAQPFTSRLILSNVKWYRQSLVWVKNKASGHLNAKKRHLTIHEDIVIFSKKPHKYHPQMWQSKPSNGATRRTHTTLYGKQRTTTYDKGKTERYPVSALNFPVVNNDHSNGGRFHPTQKPPELLEYLIKTYSNESDVILDFTMGSGSTGVACVNTGRNFIGIEKDHKYFDVASTRIGAAIKELPGVLPGYQA